MQTGKLSKFKLSEGLGDKSINSESFQQNYICAAGLYMC